MSETHPPSLNFCSSSSKAKLAAMQEIRDNTSVDPCLDLPTRLMKLYLAVPTYLTKPFVEFFTLSWVVERWNLLSMSLLLSLLLKSIGENMILYYYGSSTLGTWSLFLVCGSSPRLNKCSFSSYPLKAKYVELMSWSWSVFLLPKYWLHLLFEETLGALFSSLFYFHALSLEDLGAMMIFEEKITSSKTSFQMASIYWRWTHIPEWSYAREHG
jgi:hypothetical protein